jgi:hypothetical protein
MAAIAPFPLPIDTPLFIKGRPYVIESPEVSPAKHAHFNGCDMYKDGREAPSITGLKLFKDAVKRLVERVGGRSDFRFDYPTLGKLEEEVLENGLKPEKISIIHSPGVDLFPSAYIYANHDSGYKPQSISPDIKSILLPSSTADPGTRASSTSGAEIVDWFDGYIDLSPIGYEGITVGYIYNGATIQIQITIRNSNGTITTIDSTRNYSDFRQTSPGIDYLRAGNTVKNTAILNDTLEEIIKYLIGKALGDTLQAVELQLATQLYDDKYNNQNTCGFTTDRVLTSRYKALNQTICLQVGKESGLKQVLLFRAGDEETMKQQIKLTHKTNSIKNNNNVIFVIRQAFLYGDINVSGTPVALNDQIRIVFNTIVEYIENINRYLNEVIKIDDPDENADDIREICAQCTASHIFKPKSNKLINIKEIFDDLSSLTGITYYVVDNRFSLKQLFVDMGGRTFSQYIYSLRTTRGGDVITIEGGGGKKPDKRTKPEPGLSVFGFRKLFSSRILTSKQKREQDAQNDVKTRLLNALAEIIQDTTPSRRETERQKSLRLAKKAKAEQNFIQAQLDTTDYSPYFFTIIKWYIDEIPQLEYVNFNKSDIEKLFSDYLNNKVPTKPKGVDTLIQRLVDNYIWYREIGVQREPAPDVDDQFGNYGDSYCLIRLIIYSIIKLLFENRTIYEPFVNTMTVEGNRHINAISSDFIEPIYYILYRRFQYYGYAFFNFEHIQGFVYAYITDTIGLFDIKVFSRGVFTQEYIFDEKTDGNYVDVFTIVENARQSARNSVSTTEQNKTSFLTELIEMADDVENRFSEISMSEDEFLPAPVVERESSSSIFTFSSKKSRVETPDKPERTSVWEPWTQEKWSESQSSQESLSQQDTSSPLKTFKVSELATIPEETLEESSGGSKKRYNKKNKTKKHYQKMNKKTRKGNKNHRKTYKK